jgi:hypothetical protein
MAVLFTNNATALIASSITATSTSIILASGTGTYFPAPGAGDWFYCTIVDSSNNLEIVKVTARATDTITVVRGQDNTIGRVYAAGSVIEGRVVAAVFNDLQTAFITPTTIGINEIATVTADTASTTVNFDLATQSVMYYTANASSHWTLNFRSSSAATLNSIMTVGRSRSATFMATQGAAGFFNNYVSIDGTIVPVKWQGGVAPSFGNVFSVDVYTFAIIKTGAATFTVLGSLTRFA